jgi:hypothetical protein
MFSEDVSFITPLSDYRRVSNGHIMYAGKYVVDAVRPVMLNNNLNIQVQAF